MWSFFLMEWGVQILYIFNQNQTPRSGSANLEPLEPIFCPQILVPSATRAWRRRTAAKAERHAAKSKPLAGESARADTQADG